MRHSCFSVSRVVLLIFFFNPVICLANGGPVAWSGASGTGDIVPVDQSNIKLISEDLSISLDDDGDHYHVKASYVLENSGPPVSVQYGVPLFWDPPDFRDDDDTHNHRKLITKKERAYPNGVVIKIGDTRYPCTLQNIHLNTVEGDDDPYEETVGAWCVTKLDVPTAESIQLTLEYVASYHFVDYAYSKSPFKEFDKRQLIYDLSPASHWAGMPHLHVIINTGRWGSLFTIKNPSEFWTKDNTLEFNSFIADLKALGAITGDLDAKPVLESREREHYKVDHLYKARASSEHASTGAIGYAAKNVLDNNSTTAWCVNSEKDDNDQWIEISSEPWKLPGYCRLHSYVIVPGYAKSQDTWMSNNRVLSVKISRCNDSDPGEIIELKPNQKFDQSAIELMPRRDDLSEFKVLTPVDDGDKPALIDKFCVRLTIQKISKGKTGDTCISEFKPVVNCG